MEMDIHKTHPYASCIQYTAREVVFNRKYIHSRNGKKRIEYNPPFSHVCVASVIDENSMCLSFLHHLIEMSYLYVHIEIQQTSNISMGYYSIESTMLCCSVAILLLLVLLLLPCCSLSAKCSMLSHFST